MSNSSGLTFLSLHPFVRATVVDKVRGAVVGAALGDCIGLYTEFLSKALAEAAYPTAKFQLVEPTTPFKFDGHRNKFSSKSWTDDTDHALLIILSYLHHDGQLLPNDFAKRLRTWAEQGLRCLDRLPLGLGRTVGRVVFGKGYLKDPTKTAFEYWEHGAFNAAPNGSLMRTHPLGIICVDRSQEETFRIATEFSLVTHADPRCVVACCISTALIRGILRGEVQSEKDINAIVYIVSDWVQAWQKRGRCFSEDPVNDVEVEDEWIDASMKKDEEVSHLSPEKANPDEVTRTILETALNKNELFRHTQAKDFQELQLDDAMKMGYVYKSLGAAILALRLAMRSTTGDAIYRPSRPSRNYNPTPKNTFEVIITEIIMEAGDADTNASIAAALLGAWLGYTALPPHWRDGIAHHEWLLRKCDALCFTVGVSTDMLVQDSVGAKAYKGSDDPDTKEDGGRGFLDRDALEAREMAFMEMFLTKRSENACSVKEKEEEKRKREKGWRAKIFSR